MNDWMGISLTYSYNLRRLTLSLSPARCVRQRWLLRTFAIAVPGMQTIGAESLVAECAERAHAHGKG